MSGTPITMEMTCKWLDLEPQMKEIPYDSRTKNLIDGLTEDPEDNQDGFIPIIALHNARLKKAHLLHEATSDIIQQKWVEGTDLEHIGKFLKSWAPEPYRNKPMPKGMLQALFGITPDSQVWAPTDLSCVHAKTHDVAAKRRDGACLSQPTCHTVTEIVQCTQKVRTKNAHAKYFVLNHPSLTKSVRMHKHAKERAQAQETLTYAAGWMLQRKQRHRGVRSQRHGRRCIRRRGA